MTIKSLLATVTALVLSSAIASAQTVQYAPAPQQQYVAPPQYAPQPQQYVQPTPVDPRILPQHRVPQAAPQLVAPPQLAPAPVPPAAVAQPQLAPQPVQRNLEEEAVQRFTLWHQHKAACFKATGMIEGTHFMVNPNDNLNYLVNHSVHLDPRINKVEVQKCINLKMKDVLAAVAAQQQQQRR